MMKNMDECLISFIIGMQPEILAFESVKLEGSKRTEPIYWCYYSFDSKGIIIHYVRNVVSFREFHY